MGSGFKKVLKPLAAVSTFGASALAIDKLTEPPKIPGPAPVTELPDEELIKKQRRRSLARQTGRGRASTMLTESPAGSDYSGNFLGGG